MKPSSQTYYFHLRIKDGKTIYPCGGVTVAFQYDAELHTVFWAYSICRATDNFDKRIGRIKAAGRLSSWNWWKSLHVDPEITVSGVIGKLKEEVIVNLKDRNSDLVIDNLK